MPAIVHVTARYDHDAKVWVAHSNDVPGLFAEAETFEDLREIVCDLVPDLLYVDAHLTETELSIPVQLTANYDFITTLPAGH